MTGRVERRGIARSVRGYLDTPTMGVPPLVAVRRMREAVTEWSRGEARFEEWERDAEACRGVFAELMGVESSDVALIPSVAPAAAAVAEALRARRGMIVAHVAEYRSLLLPFLARFEDARVRWVDGPYTASTFSRAIRRDVTAVVLSSISSADGSRLDLASLVDAGDAVGAVLVVDATQSLGTASLGVPTDRLGALFAAGYKGLLGPRGTAYAYVRADVGASPAVVPSPYGMADAHVAGAYGPPLMARPGAGALDQSPAWLSWIGALPALRWVTSTSDAEREAHTTSLAERFRAGLVRLGLDPQPTDRPSPIVSVPLDHPQLALELLSVAGIRAAVRRGRLRFGFHVYNSPRDVARALSALASPAIRRSS